MKHILTTTKLMTAQLKFDTSSLNEKSKSGHTYFAIPDNNHLKQQTKEALPAKSEYFEPYAKSLNPNNVQNKLGEVQINAQTLFGKYASEPINKMYHKNPELSNLNLSSKNVDKLVDLENKASIDGYNESYLGAAGTPIRRIAAHFVAGHVVLGRGGDLHNEQHFDSYSHESTIILNQ